MHEKYQNQMPLMSVGLDYPQARELEMKFSFIFGNKKKGER